MDEFTQPKRAAKLRSKYVERSVVSDNEPIASHRDEDNHSESGSDNEELKMRVKRTRLSVPLSSQATRRSSRQINRDVLYNVNIHPQDVEIKMLESSQEHQEHHSDDTNTESQAKADNENENEYETDNEQDNEQDNEDRDIENIIDRTIPDTDGSGSEDSLSTYTEPSPMPSVGQKRSLANDTRLKDERSPPPGRHSLGSDQPFTIYTEGIQAQLHAEASAAPPVEYIDDDKENNVRNPNLEPTPDPLDAIHVQSALEYRQNANHENVEYHTDFDRFMDVIDQESPGYRIPDIDGAMDDDDDEAIELKFGLDSVFGKPSPEDSVVGGDHGRHPNPSRSRDSECDSVLGFPSSG